MAYAFPKPNDMAHVDYVLVDLLEYFPPSWWPREAELGVLRPMPTCRHSSVVLPGQRIPSSTILTFSSVENLLVLIMPPQWLHLPV